MKRLCTFMGEHQGNRPVCVLATEAQIRKAYLIGRMMTAVGKNVPWECKCLAEALCVKWLLDRYRIPSVSFLGAHLAPEDEKGMKAHAWLSVGPRIMIGGPGHEPYRVTAVFTETARSPKAGNGMEQEATKGTEKKQVQAC
jgi:hypothetical protein